MNPKEKALELVAKYQQLKITTHGCGAPGNTCIVSNSMLEKSAIRCAIITVDEIMDGNFADGYNHLFWEDVKNIPFFLHCYEIEMDLNKTRIDCDFKISANYGKFAYL